MQTCLGAEKSARERLANRLNKPRPRHLHEPSVEFTSTEALARTRLSISKIFERFRTHPPILNHLTVTFFRDPITGMPLHQILKTLSFIIRPYTYHLRTWSSPLEKHAGCLILLNITRPLAPFRPMMAIPKNVKESHPRDCSSSTHRPAGPCETVSRSEAAVPAPSADFWPYLTTCENPTARLTLSTRPRTQPSDGQ